MAWSGRHWRAAFTKKVWLIIHWPVTRKQNADLFTHLLTSNPQGTGCRPFHTWTLSSQCVRGFSPTWQGGILSRSSTKYKDTFSCSTRLNLRHENNVTGWENGTSRNTTRCLWCHFTQLSIIYNVRCTAKHILDLETQKVKIECHPII